VPDDQGDWEDDEDAAAGVPGQLAVDVYETEEKLVVKARTAGVNKQDLDVSISDGILTISGTLSSGDDTDATQWHIQECYWGEFSRTLALPAAVTISMAGDAFGPVTSQAVSGNTTGGTPTLAVVTAGVAPTQYTVATNITSGVQYLHGATAMETATITGPGRRRVSIRDEVLVQASVFAQWTTRIVMAPSTVGLPPAGSGTNGVLEQWKTLFEFYPL